MLVRPSIEVLPLVLQDIRRGIGDHRPATDLVPSEVVVVPSGQVKLPRVIDNGRERNEGGTGVHVGKEGEETT